LTVLREKRARHLKGIAGNLKKKKRRRKKRGITRRNLEKHAVRPPSKKMGAHGKLRMTHLDLGGVKGKQEGNFEKGSIGHYHGRSQEGSATVASRWRKPISAANGRQRERRKITEERKSETLSERTGSQGGGEPKRKAFHVKGAPNILKL